MTLLYDHCNTKSSDFARFLSFVVYELMVELYKIKLK